MADIQFPNQFFGPGSFTADVIDNSGAPATVLEAGLPFTIKTAWDVGPLAAQHLGGQWTVTAYVESIGPGREQAIATETLAVNGSEAYQQVLTVNANTLPNDPQPPDSGVYKLVTVLTHRNFGRLTNVAAVVEAPVLRIA